LAASAAFPEPWEESTHRHKHKKKKRRKKEEGTDVEGEVRSSLERK
jgi:hypothetical protein